jgi:hypothetical protein
MSEQLKSEDFDQFYFDNLDYNVCDEIELKHAIAGFANAGNDERSFFLSGVLANREWQRIVAGCN